MPIITLEVMTQHSGTQTELDLDEPYSDTCQPDQGTGVHFLTEKQSQDDTQDSKETLPSEPTKTRQELLEYKTQSDGSVVCKLCGEILQSRTHWYRHKYKVHVIQPLNPAPLFQCEQCLVYFKSRKGYIGHLASRHNDLMSDSSPVLTNSQIEASNKEKEKHSNVTTEEEPSNTDAELSIPKSTLPNFNSTSINKSLTKEVKKGLKNIKVEQPQNEGNCEEKRSREEKLVADIIDRVRRECEAQGSGPARRGYTRRTTVMHSI